MPSQNKVSSLKLLVRNDIACVPPGWKRLLLSPDSWALADFVPNLFVDVSRCHHSGNHHFIVSVSLSKAFDYSIFIVSEGKQVSS